METWLFSGLSALRWSERLCEHKCPYVLVVFFSCYLALPQVTLGHSQGDSLTNQMLITTFEPCNKVGYLSPTERLAGFKLGTFQFWLQHFNPLGHSQCFLFMLTVKYVPVFGCNWIISDFLIQIFYCRQKIADVNCDIFRSCQQMCKSHWQIYFSLIAHYQLTPL